MPWNWPNKEQIADFVKLDHAALQREASAHELTGLSTMEVPTLFGIFTICASAFGASFLFFPETDDFDVSGRYSYYGLAYAGWGRKMAFEAGLELLGYTVGEVREFETPVDLSFLSPFQQDILLAVRRIPFGATVTSPELAEMAGHPGKGGAAVHVLRHNPLPILVPCHRVLSADGHIGPYCHHPESKRFLLSHEGVEIALPLA